MESNQCFKYGVYVRGQLSYANITYVKKATFGFKKQVNASMIFLLDICLIQLYLKKVFREQVKACLRNTFRADTNQHISKTLQKQNTRVLELVVFYELGNTNPRKMFKVLSCVIYKIIDRYVCIDYLGTEIKKMSELRLGCTLKTNMKVWTMTTYLVLVLQIYIA